MSIQLNPLVAHLVKNIPEDSAPHFRSQYDKLIAERNTSDVWRQFALWLLIDPDHGVIRFTKYDSKQHAAIQRVARLYDENCKDRKLWDKAAWHTHRATSSAAGAAAYYSATAAAKADADADADAWAARAAASAAADSTAWAGHPTAAFDADPDATIAAWAARAAACKHMAEKLLELLQLAPPKETP